MTRKCIYTDKDSNAKDRVIPKKLIENSEEKYNWTNTAPAYEKYINTKKDRLPLDIEMDANEVFHLLELAKLRVKYYELRLKEIQERIKEQNQLPKISKTENKKIDKILHQEEVTEKAVEKIDEMLEERLKLWDE